MPLSHLGDSVHLARNAGVVDRDDGLRAGRDRIFDDALVDVECVRPDVYEDGNRATEGDGVRRRDEREGGHDYLIARLEVEQDRRHLERRCGRVHEQRLPCPGRLLKPLRALLAEAPAACELCARDGVEHVFELGAHRLGTIERDSLDRAQHRAARGDCLFRSVGELLHAALNVQNSRICCSGS
jgi:hypothetical protein